ncbi:MAG: hypothetical protein U1F29_06500 [Planctomycetota bacterium]
MAEPIATYRTEVSGLWTRRHTVWKDQEKLGVLTVERRGLVVSVATWRPEKGEVLTFRRDPGILRSQFSLWTEGHEWLGSSLRWSFLRREISLSTGNKPHRVLPLPTFRRGWRLVAPKTGELLRLLPGLLGRSARIEVYRKVDFELLLFAYFLGSMLWTESFWPAHAAEDESDALLGGGNAGRAGAANSR